MVLLKPVGVEMRAPAGMVDVEDEANAPAVVESCIAEDVIAKRRRDAAALEGTKAAALEEDGAVAQEAG